MFLARVCRRPLRSFHGGLLVLSSKELCNLRFIAKSAVTLNGEGPKSVQHRDANSSRSVLEKVLIKEDEQPNTTAGKVKKGVATSFYITAGAISAVAIGALIYCLFDYLWAPDSPQRIYSKALKAIKNDAQCADLLGDSIKGFGEDTGRGRRRHIMNKRYFKDGEERVRVKFHVKGSKCAADATAEVARVDGTWTDRFLFVETKTVVPEVVIIVDNRN